MAQDAAPIRFAASGPTVIMVCGVNGAGKTTSIAKLAAHVQGRGQERACSGPATRSAPRPSSSSPSGRSGSASSIVTGEPGAHPASVAYRAVEQAVENGIDVCIVDTAGRLQTQKNLMAELTKIQDAIRKQIPEAPHEVLLVLDATTGQNGISQAQTLPKAVDCTGIVLAKLDGTAKGGVVVAIRQQVGLPVKYIGVGEKAEDLALFEPDEFVDALFADIEATAPPAPLASRRRSRHLRASASLRDDVLATASDTVALHHASPRHTFATATRAHRCDSPHRDAFGSDWLIVTVDTTF